MCQQIVINLSIPLGTTMPLIRSLIEAEFSRNASTASVLRGIEIALTEQLVMV